MDELALFAGAGGGILGGQLLGWKTVCAVEIDPYAASVLIARQNDGILPPFPVWDDIRTFDGKPWRGLADVVSGGFPCQDVSVAGKGAGINGSRSGLWSEMARIIGEVGPEFVFVENSPMLVGRGLALVLGDLAKMGFNARWCVLGGGRIGSICEGERLWILAFSPDSLRREEIRSVQDIKFNQKQPSRRQFDRAIGATLSEDDLSSVRRNPDVVARGMDRLKAIGNGQVPALARRAWEILTAL